MTDCETCGKDVLMPFECNFCGGYFCGEHRLPENHNCTGSPARTPLGSYQSRQATSTEKKAERGMVSEGSLHFERKTERSQRPLRHFRIRAWHLGAILALVGFLMIYCAFTYPFFVERGVLIYTIGFGLLLLGGAILGIKLRQWVERN